MQRLLFVLLGTILGCSSARIAVGPVNSGEVATHVDSSPRTEVTAATMPTGFISHDFVVAEPLALSGIGEARLIPERGILSIDTYRAEHRAAVLKFTPPPPEKPRPPRVG
jgi:hypothetical protein